MDKEMMVTLGVFAVTAGMIGWDALVAVDDGETKDTISDILLSAAKKRPVTTLAVGLLLGHLFWPQGRDG